MTDALAQDTPITWLLTLAVVGAPLLSAVVTLFTKGRWQAWIPVALMTLSASASIGLLIVQFPHEASTAINWFAVGGATVSVGIQLDALSVPLLAVITTVSLLVHLYSAAYMKGDAAVGRYLVVLGFFTASMSMLILASNLLLVFVCWELIGFCSYLLIGHWQHKPAAARAATKAFLMNRLADLGFLIALMMWWSQAGTLDIATILETSVPASGTLISLCLIIGAFGKSAQFPFYNWLPDAMEGPTPVSALIHAATLVAAGVYLLIRLHGLLTPVALDVVLIIGALTALAGALSAWSQVDLKKILAYSTISQLGLMMMGIGAASPGSATLHLFTHAFFKAGLFLVAGAVIHAIPEAQDIRQAGNLHKKLPVTFGAFLVTAAALAGLPFTSGFISKDAILTALSLSTNPLYVMALLTGFLVSLITALYMVRVLWFVFLMPGPPTHAHEAPLPMRIAMLALALLSVWFVAAALPWGESYWLHTSHSWMITVMSAAWVSGAVVLGWFIYRRQTVPRSTDWLQNGFYLDSFYTQLAVPAAHYLARVVNHVDTRWIDRALHLFVYVQVGLAHAIAWFDSMIVDGLVSAVAYLASVTGALIRSFQGGRIQLYIFWALTGLIIFLFFNWTT